MRRQLERLLAAMRAPNVVIRIVPADGSIYPSGAFNLLSFHEDADVAYVESVGGYGQIVERGGRVNDLGVLFDQIGAVALPVADSEKLIRAVLEEM